MMYLFVNLMYLFVNGLMKGYSGRQHIGSVKSDVLIC